MSHKFPPKLPLLDARGRHQSPQTGRAKVGSLGYDLFWLQLLPVPQSQHFLFM